MALIPPAFLNAVVAIQKIFKKPDGTDVPKVVATGFLIGYPVGEDSEKRPLFKLFIVTNRHVFQNSKTQQYETSVTFRLNTQENGCHNFLTPLVDDGNNPLWLQHSDPKVDLAILPINAKALTNVNIDYFCFQKDYIAYSTEFADKGISVGDGLFVLGFPNGIGGKAKNFVILRQGIISRVDEEIISDGYFYIDSAIYPGNSGGPVIVKPSNDSITGTKQNTFAQLIGVVSKGETYSDIAISEQTGEKRVVFTQEMGLVRIVPMECVYQIIEANIKKPTPESQIEATPDISELEVDPPS